MEYSYGIIPYYKDSSNEWQFLIVQHISWHRWFPKWHCEKWETPQQTAIRETEEEVGIKHIHIQADKQRNEQYHIKREWKTIPKSVWYFLWYVDIEKEVIQIQKKELSDYKVCSYTQAHKTLSFWETKNILTQAYKHLCTYHKSP